MATTIVAAHFDGARMWVGHVGDSRAYLLRGQSLHRLTDDHSQLAHLLRLGDVRGANQAEIARLDSVLTQALGASERVVPAVTRVQVERGDCFLLATDGITKALTQADMLALMLSSTSPDQACQKQCNLYSGRNRLTAAGDWCIGSDERPWLPALSSSKSKGTRRA
jgi:serine/threonine protein phosphatase PrpC